jgi:hypothetical protein
MLRFTGGPGSIAAFDGRGNADRGHSGSGCGLDAERGVFEDQAILWRDAEASGGN